MKILSTQLILLLFIFLNLPVAFGGFISNCSTCGGPSVKENKSRNIKAEIRKATTIAEVISAFSKI